MAAKTRENRFHTTNKPSFGSKLSKKGNSAWLYDSDRQEATELLFHFFKKTILDKWVVNTVSRSYTLELLTKLIDRYLAIPKNKCPLKHRLLESAIQHLLDIRVIERLPRHHRAKGAYSIFIISKKNGDARAILDLKWLNKKIRKKKFKMETRCSILATVQKGDFMSSLQNLFAHSKSSEPPQISEVRIQQCPFSVSCASFWTQIFSPGIHQSPCSSGGQTENAKNLTLPISGRHFGQGTLFQEMSMGPTVDHSDMGTCLASTPCKMLSRYADLKWWSLFHLMLYWHLLYFWLPFCTASAKKTNKATWYQQHFISVQYFTQDAHKKIMTETPFSQYCSRPLKKIRTDKKFWRT